MKMTVSILGVALLTGLLALTQASSTGQKSSKSKKTADTSATSQSTSSNANSSSDTSGQESSGAQSADTPTSQVKVGNSGFDDINSDKTGGSSGIQDASSNGNSGRVVPPADGSSSTPASSYRQSASQSPSSTGTISNGPVAETITDHSALIGWATHDAAGNTGVKFGTNSANLTESVQGTDGVDGKNHHARLQGLQPNTRYYFQVTENGSPVGGVGIFKTTATGDAPIQSKAIVPQK